ncbi:MAG TPA: S9 family peptidase [Candidatus Paceibacterota bacterium]|nr:S9 family peptidase [Verrucomicrobiota bacterium]HRY48173.1 S9 family peptidase [Candidatus Paceibacterota bacterium]HSA01037.1 S9 family peptidase [Candidatus Paceibacterota bacterium]
MKMIPFLILLLSLRLPVVLIAAQTPENLVTQGIPPVPENLRKEAGRYLEFRAAAFQGWHPIRHEILVTTRFADVSQLHGVKAPGGARRQLTFLSEPVSGGSFRPGTGDCIVFSQDTGGGEFYQLYRYDVADGKTTLLTDGRSRNSAPCWSKNGRWLAYSSTRRNGRDTDIYLMDPSDPATDRRLIELTGGGWSVADWSPDDTRLLLREYLSINESHLHLVDVGTGVRELITPHTGSLAAWSQAAFDREGKSLFVTTDLDSPVRRLCRFELKTRRLTSLTPELRWDVEQLALSHDGRTLAYVSNEDGAGVLHLMNAKTGRPLRQPRVPLGVITALEWHEDDRFLAFGLSSARSPNDVFVLERKTGRIERWTESETGGLDSNLFVEPEIVRMRSFDGLGISALVYRPDPRRYPGRRPVVISIHGGPESQSRPGFQARWNYLLNEMGVALVFPNVRGSDGYGKDYLALDNGIKREDTVKDIGAVIGWVKQDSRLDADRVAVMGGSYGGYMVLASLIHFGEDLRCGIDIVGISNFLTFLKNTQDYRRDLRRAEYGDERKPDMAAFLQRISPTAQVGKIQKPLFVAQGQNDPRVPVTESEQMVKAIQEQGGKIWYLLAKDEGHGFQKKRNADYLFLSTLLFLEEHLLK